jgi:hypothetical protein
MTARREYAKTRTACWSFRVRECLSHSSASERENKEGKAERKGSRRKSPDPAGLD